MGRRAYFWVLLWRSLRERRRSAAVSILTIALGTSVVAAFLAFYADIESKMSRELRAYGANLVLRPVEEGGHLGEAARAALDATVPRGQLVGAQSLLYGIVTLKRDRVTAVGIEFGRIASTTPYWQVFSGTVPAAGEQGACLLGKDVAARLHLEVGAPLMLGQEERARGCTVAALVDTGGAEDEQVFLPIEAARALFSRPGEVDVVLASVVADVEQAESYARALERRVPGCRAEPIRKLSRSEGVVLATIRSLVYVSVALISLSTVVGLLMALLAMVSERRREVALEKALGATDGLVALHFLAEVTVTALVGGVIGLLAGYGIAGAMERAIFGTTVAFHLWLVPLAIASALAMTVAGALVPLRAISLLRPAVVLKGE